MSNYISEHLHPDESIQHQLESEKAKLIEHSFNRNLKALDKYIPTLATQLKSVNPTTTSIFVNKLNQLNIVNFTNGRVLYPVDAQQAIDEQIKYWMQNSVLYDVKKKQSLKLKDEDFENLGQSYFEQIQKAQQKIDTLVVLGVGNGYCLNRLLDLFSVNYLVIYETDWQFLYASLFSADWHQLLEYCMHKNITVFVQTSTDFFTDLQELGTTTSAQHVLCFQHLHSAVFDKFMQELRGDSSQSNSLRLENAEMNIWLPSTDLSDWELLAAPTVTYDLNMSLFEEYYPDIYSIYKNYNARIWLPVRHKETQQITLLHRFSLCLYSQAPAADAKQAVMAFADNPNREPLVMGHMGNKLNHFAFNQFFTQVGAILASQSQQKVNLPERMELLIHFGLGNGYHLNEMMQLIKVKHLFITEPNADFFYWSLLVADWQHIFKEAINNEGQMFLNIGGLDASLMADYTRQFNIIGNHHVANYWIFQGYATDSIDHKLHELRSSLRSVFAISDNFDHSFYGIEHFLYSVEEKIPYLHKKINHSVSEFKNQPVLLVGNGPSIDTCIEHIKAHQDKAIIVSCGTALKSLYKHNIQPDFHAEIEVYRANYDWITQIQDPSYFSAITLISVDGIHPDNIALFKNTLLALKNGEASTVLVNHLYPDNQYIKLSGAYPTVSNFALSFFANAGFKEIYLIGIDLGFSDLNRHHGKDSGYYQNGKEVHKIQQSADNMLQVAGNFGTPVFTKFEFNMARTVMEQVLQEHPLDCYNTSNGAKINGAMSLQPDDIFILTKPDDKRNALQAFASSFDTLAEDFTVRFEKTLSPQNLSTTISRIKDSLPSAFSSSLEISDFVSGRDVDRKEFNDTFGKLLLRTTVQCCFAALLRVSQASDEQVALSGANQILQAFKDLLSKAAYLSSLPGSRWDISVAFAELRETNQLSAEKPYLYDFDNSMERFVKQESIDALFNQQDTPLNRWPGKGVIVVEQNQLMHLKQRLDALPKCDALIVSSDLSVIKQLVDVVEQKTGIALLWFGFTDWKTLARGADTAEDRILNLPLLQNLCTTLLARYSQRNDYSLMLQKPRFNLYPHIRKMTSDPQHPANAQLVVDIIELINENANLVSFKHYFALSKQEIKTGTVLDSFGSRGLHLTRKLYPSDILDYCYTPTNHHQLMDFAQEYFQSV